MRATDDKKNFEMADPKGPAALVELDDRDVGQQFKAEHWASRDGQQDYRLLLFFRAATERLHMQRRVIVQRTGMPGQTIDRAAVRLERLAWLEVVPGLAYEAGMDPVATSYRITLRGLAALSQSPLGPPFLMGPMIGLDLNSSSSLSLDHDDDPYQDQDQTYTPNRFGPTRNSVKVEVERKPYLPGGTRRGFDPADPLFSERASGLWGLVVAEALKDRERISLPDLARLWAASQEQARQRVAKWLRKKVMLLVRSPDGNYVMILADRLDTKDLTPDRVAAQVFVRRERADRQVTDFRKNLGARFDGWASQAHRKWREESGRQQQLDDAIAPS